MKQRFFDLSIKYKILLVFLAFLLLYSIVFYLYSVDNTRSGLMGKVGSSNAQILRQISRNLSFMRREVEDMSTQLVLQSDVQQYIQPIRDQEDYETKLYIDMGMKKAVNLIANKDYVSTLAVVGFENKSIPFLRSIDKRISIPDMDQLQVSPFFARVAEANGKPVWSDRQEDLALFSSSPRFNRILMARIIKEYNTYEPLGMLLLSINEQALRDIYTQGIQVEEGSILIWSDNGVLSEAGLALTQQEKAEMMPWQGQEYHTASLGGKEYLISYFSDEDVGWHYGYAVPMEYLTRQVFSVSRYFLLVAVAALLLFFPVVLFATELITRPMKKLLGAMSQFQTGDFETHIDFRSQDEIGQLGHGFNEMVDHIESLISRVYVLKIKEREAELTALQSQINPHFLYNTLDSIHWKAQKNQQPEIADMVWHLSELFRMSLNKGNRFGTVASDFCFIRRYLSLQQLRYGDRITHRIELSPEVESLEIPKLLLQPFVENAVYHGLEAKAGTGLIEVSCEMVEGMLEFRVFDDGVGMPQETARELEQGNIKGEHRMGGYAVGNIVERLNLVYGKNYTLTVRSHVGQGTEVKLRLPTYHPEMEELA